MNSYDFFIHEFICFMNSYMNSGVPRFQMALVGKYSDHIKDGKQQRLMLQQHQRQLVEGPRPHPTHPAARSPNLNSRPCDAQLTGAKPLSQTMQPRSSPARTRTTPWPGSLKLSKQF